MYDKDDDRLVGKQELIEIMRSITKDKLSMLPDDMLHEIVE